MSARRWHDWDRRLIGWFLAALVLLVMLFGDPVGVGADAGPESASPTELCWALDDMATARDRLVDGDPDYSVARLREAATQTREVGGRTTGLDRQAAEGLRFFTGLFLTLPDDATTQQLLSAGAPASVTDQAHSDAFVDWLDAHCSSATPPPARP